MGKLVLIGLSVTSLALLVALTFLGYQRTKVQRLVIAAGSSKAESYVLSQALKTVVERHYSKIRITLLETGGTSESLDLLEHGKAQLAAAQADVAAGPSARMVAVLFEDKFQLLAHKAKGIRRFTDLQGKRIALPRTGGQFQSFLHIAEHFGLAESAFVFVGEDENAADQAFSDEAADATFRVRALGNASIARLAHARDVRFIAIEHAAAMQIELPAFAPATIPEGAYVGNPPIPESDLPTVAVERTLLAHKDVPVDLIYAMTETLMERRQELAAAIPDEAAGIRPLLASIKQPIPRIGLGVAIHAGATAYYERDNPSFIRSHADFAASALTVLVLVGSWVWQLKRWIERRQKNQADQYNDSVLVLMHEAQASALVKDLQRIRSELLKMLTAAVEDLDRDRISEESFQSFRVVWQIAAEVVRERRESLVTGDAQEAAARA